jgi:vacuolar-type H+-ATPase subunit E/Vma4
MAAASDQIRQMVNFILQEAHEKANEIRVKVSKDRFCFVLDREENIEEREHSKKDKAL